MWHLSHSTQSMCHLCTLHLQIYVKIGPHLKEFKIDETKTVRLKTGDCNFKIEVIRENNPLTLSMRIVVLKSCLSVCFRSIFVQIMDDYINVF